MKYCSKCKVKINTDQNRCPLCSMDISRPIDEEDSGTLEAELTEDSPAPAGGGYPPMQVQQAHKYNFVVRLFILLSVVGGSTCVLINIMTFSGVLWSVIVVGTILFAWATVGYPIIFKRNIGHIIIVDAVSASLYMFIIELITREKGWGLTYVTPFLLIGATAMITSIILAKRLKWREYTIYQTVMVILGFLPVFFCILGLVSVAWPSIVSAFYSFLTVTGMYIFGHRKYGNELKKRFHI